MDAVSFVGIDIKVVAWDDQTSEAVAEEWLEVPPAVDAYNVESYVMGRFGAPLDVATNVYDVYGEIVVGWVFSAEALAQVELPSEGLQMLAVPFVRFRDGTRRELYEYNAELNEEFLALVRPLVPHAEIAGGAPPRESRGRLEDELLEFARTERADVELQITGWLRRMLAEGWTYLVIELADTGRYVQFLTHEGNWLRAEAVGDRYLTAHSPLTASERAGLIAKGWHEPTEDGDECGNYWLDWGGDDDDELAYGPVQREVDVTDRDVEHAAAIAAATLCEIFGPLAGDSVTIHAGPAHTDAP